MIPLQMLLASVLGWLEREQCDVIAFLREENRALKAQLGTRRLRLEEDQRRRLAVLGHELGPGISSATSRGFAGRPPKVEYRLTDWGQSLCPALDQLLTWAEQQPSSQSGDPALQRRA